jgi:hypothetical protein
MVDFLFRALDGLRAPANRMCSVDIWPTEKYRRMSDAEVIRSHAGRGSGASGPPS